MAVVDDGSRLLSVIRFDGGGYATTDVALRKAETFAMNREREPSADAEKVTLERLTVLAFRDRLPLQASGRATCDEGR